MHSVHVCGPPAALGSSVCNACADKPLPALGCLLRLCLCRVAAAIEQGGGRLAAGGGALCRDATHVVAPPEAALLWLSMGARLRLVCHANTLHCAAHHHCCYCVLLLPLQVSASFRLHGCTSRFGPGGSSAACPSPPMPRGTCHPPRSPWRLQRPATGARTAGLSKRDSHHRRSTPAAPRSSSSSSSSRSCRP